MNPSIAEITRTEINRANAKHSTGPKTQAGKHRSSLNALRHGLTGQTIVMPAEDLEAYQHHIQSFVDEYHPQGPTEIQLVQSLADAAWRLNRVSALETNLLTHDIIYDDFPNHESTHEMREAIAIAAALDSHTKALANLSIHGQRLSRQFERTVAQLQKLQETRRAKEEQDLDNFLDITEMYEEKGETYDPSEDGFVFSEAQINATILRRNRERLLEEVAEYESAAA